MTVTKSDAGRSDPQAMPARRRPMTVEMSTATNSAAPLNTSLTQFGTPASESPVRVNVLPLEGRDPESRRWGLAEVAVFRGSVEGAAALRKTSGSCWTPPERTPKTVRVTPEAARE
ncbi:MAG: hypothetical protein NVSMB16_13460 [Acidimicrobiales bacterium]